MTCHKRININNSLIAKVNSLFFMHRAFSHDITAAILVFRNNKTEAMLVFKSILWEINSFLMKTLPFVSINLHG